MIKMTNSSRGATPNNNKL
jgi:hypothetical protein